MDQSWLKISVVNNEANIMEVANGFLTRFAKTLVSGKRVSRECAAFIERQDREEPSVNVYFSPIAAMLCQDFINDYPSEISGPPDPSRVESLGGHGDDMEWLASLSDRDHV